LLPSNLKHIAIIMDGNGRWAKKHFKPRSFGHKKGSENVKKIIKTCINLELKTLSLFAFSFENWERPKSEVNFIVKLFDNFLDTEAKNFVKQNIILKISGDLSKFPSYIEEKCLKLIEKTSQNTGLTLNIALSYGGRQEILNACKNLCCDFKDSKIKIEDIDFKAINDRLWTSDLEDPDLLIRTSGETRISNFMLWQLAYSEIYFTSVLWPDFNELELKKAIEFYKTRERRFGKV
jgi:undecaprenyl diphosphate synthase